MNIPMWEILVPYKIKKSIVHITHHRIWDSKVMEISQGMTILKATKGKWQSPSGKLHHELMIPVRISCTEKQIKEIMSFTIEHYQQEAVLAYKVSDKTLILYK